MNIFWIEPYLYDMAKSLCDQHYSRMIYETCVILGNAYYSTDEQHLVPNIYRKHYYNHPQCRWARKNIVNYVHIVEYLRHLLDSYYQHGGKAWQKEKSFLNSFCENPPTLPVGKLTNPYLTFGNKDNLELDKKYKAIQAQYGTWNNEEKVWETNSWDIAIQAYRTYYRMKIFKEGKLPRWTKNQKPEWYLHTNISLINLDG